MTKLSREEILASIRQIASEMNDDTCREKLGALLLFCVQMSNSLDFDCEVLLHQTVKKMVESCQSLGKDGKRESDTFKPLTFKDLGVY